MGYNFEMIQGIAVGIEWFRKEEIDDFGYVVLEFFFLRLVIAY